MGGGGGGGRKWCTPPRRRDPPRYRFAATPRSGGVPQGGGGGVASQNSAWVRGKETGSGSACSASRQEAEASTGVKCHGRSRADTVVSMAVNHETRPLAVEAGILCLEVAFESSRCQKLSQLKFRNLLGVFLVALLAPPQGQRCAEQSQRSAPGSGGCDKSGRQGLVLLF